MELKDGINLIYGENESGKSTLLKFIEACFYGLSKNKNGKNISDFDRYQPWDDTEFSGKIKYTLDNGKQYEVFRDFKKKNPVIYRDNEDISKEFRMDKTKGIRFLEELIGVEENAFSNTVVIKQQEIKLEKAEANAMVQKISNLVSAGDDNISFQKSMTQLNKWQNEMVGTERTKQKPINLVDERLKNLTDEKRKLKEYQEKFLQQDEQEEQIQAKVAELQNQKQTLKATKQSVSDDKIKTMETQFKIKIGMVLAVVLFVIGMVMLMMLKPKLWAILPLGLFLSDVLVTVKMFQKAKKKKANWDMFEIEKEMEQIEEKINDWKLKNHIWKTEKQKLDEKLEQLARIEEEMDEQKRMKEELVSLNISYEIAKECLEKAYEEIKHNLSPKFQEKLCEITENVTDGKYKKIALNEENGLYLEVENGSYKPVERLSIGTMDEMYLALRLSILEEMAQENLPIFLDETFAYFDDTRLKNMIRYLQDKNYHHQIVIFTCSKREEEVLKQLKIEYHRIHLEK